MHLVINGERQSVDDGRTLEELIRRLGLTDRPIAVELNRKLVRQSEYAGTLLRDGDRLEIVHFVGGG